MTPSDKTAIENLLQSYASALGSSSTADVISLYTKDAVFLAQHFTTVEGLDNIEETYNQIFKAITLKVTMDVKEVVLGSGEWAFARTTTEGLQRNNATGEQSKEGNQELFVVQKVDGEWKLARYCFCSTNPPK